MNSTICAISTSLGVGAISIIRVSGPDAIKIVNNLFDGKDLTKVPTHTIHYGHCLIGFLAIAEDVFNKEIIDEVLVSVMLAPKTFTMEDIVEINSHGGPATTNKILELLLLNGCIQAEPGEFTKRAFLNGRIDLVEAESISDLISSQTEKSRKLAINGVTKNISNKINDIRKDIMDIQANIEVNIDYPEYEEGEKYTKESLKPLIDKVYSKINELLSNSKNGKIIKDGISVALVGKPNVGKSSILNALLEEEKAIVTNIPGTTRDIVEGKINLDGIILNIIDTAGIRKTNDIVEQIGVEKSLKMIGEADLIIYVLNNNEELTSEDLETINELQSKQSIIFINKNDLDNKIDLRRLSNYNIITGNTLNYEGLTNLKNEIKRLFNLNEIEQEDYTYLSNARQIALITKAKDMIENIYNNYENVPIDMFTIDLKNTYETLGEIIGATYKDDLLDELFSKFCLGK